MKVTVKEWRLHELTVLDVEKLPTNLLDHEGERYRVDCIEFSGKGVTLEVSRLDEAGYRRAAGV